ncbi:MAG: prepilin-type N-terminal cleavage/methylation domain-containing protein [Pseudomonadota bacterium]
MMTTPTFARTKNRPREPQRTHARRYACQTNSAGFSLFETLVVLALIAITATLAASAASPRSSSARLHSAVAQLVADLKETRMRAMLTGAAMEIQIDGDRYMVATADIERTLPKRITIESTTETIIIDPHNIAGQLEISVSDGEASAIVEIAALTGEIRVRAP